jgi:hypothetical protein
MVDGDALPEVLSGLWGKGRHWKYSEYGDRWRHLNRSTLGPVKEGKTLTGSTQIPVIDGDILTEVLSGLWGKRNHWKYSEAGDRWRHLNISTLSSVRNGQTLTGGTLRPVIDGDILTEVLSGLWGKRRHCRYSEAGDKWGHRNRSRLLSDL